MRAKLIALIALCALGSTQAQAAIVYDTNLIQNPGAEVGVTVTAGTYDVTDWTIQSGPAVGSGGFSGFSWTYGSGYPVLSDPGPAARGDRFFYGGKNNAFSSATQALTDFGAGVESQIDNASVEFFVSGWFGGYFTNSDTAQLQVRFFDATDSLLDQATLDGLVVSQTGLFYEEDMGVVPSGTRSIEFVLSMTRVDGASNDGYADNLSFSMHAVPEPRTLPLAIAGLSCLGIAVAKNRRTRK